MTVEVTDANFNEQVVQSDKLVLVDFWAEWCGPCRMIAPFLKELAEEYEGKIIVGKLDVDNNPETAGKYGIRNIPTVLFIKGGEVVDKIVGAVPKGNFSSKIDSLI